jgi:hypothetical protein
VLLDQLKEFAIGGLRDCDRKRQILFIPLARLIDNVLGVSSRRVEGARLIRSLRCGVSKDRQREQTVDVLVTSDLSVREIDSRQRQ